MWEKVDSKKIIKFFTEYKTTSLARQNNAKSIREYISLCNKNKNQLTNWSVLLASGSHKTIEFNNPLLKNIHQSVHLGLLMQTKKDLKIFGQ